MHSSRRACLEKNGGVSHGVRFGNTSTSAAGLQPVRRLTLTLQSWQTLFQVVNFSLFSLPFMPLLVSPDPLFFPAMFVFSQVVKAVIPFAAKSSKMIVNEE